MNRSRQALGLVLVAAVWVWFGVLRFDQGLDLAGTGRWVLGGGLEASGRAVHAVVDTGDGPLRYLLLAAWMKLAGPGFSAAASLLVLLHAVLAGLLFVWSWPRSRIGALLAQLALLAAAPLPFGPLWAGLTLLVPALLPRRFRPALVAGLFLSGLMLTDAPWFLAAATALVLGVGSDRRRIALRRAAIGLGVGLALALVQALASGAVGPTLTNAFAGPWSGLSWGPGPLLGALGHGAWLDRPFAGLATGERLPEAWPLHAPLRALGWRMAGIAVLLGPLLALAHRRPGPAAGLGIAGLVLVLGRGDLPTLGSAVVLAALATTLAGRADGRLRAIAVACVIGGLLVPLAENGWLGVHASRPGLVRWDAPRSGTKISAARRDGLQQAIDQLHLPPDQPALIWPDLAGLHVLLESRPAVRWLRVPASGAADRSVAAALAADPPPVVLFAPAPVLLPQNLERRLPRTATTLRHDYRLRGSLPAGGLHLRAIAAGARPGDPLAAELPRVECMVAPSAQTLSPALRDDLAIGQSFRIETDDLRGFAISLVTQADSVEVELRARVWERPGTQFNSLLDARTVTLVARRNQPMHWVEFPVADTAGRDLALLFETRRTPAADVRFAWHEDAGPDGIGDVYEQGSAMLDFTPIDADLVMLIY